MSTSDYLQDRNSPLNKEQEDDLYPTMDEILARVAQLSFRTEQERVEIANAVQHAERMLYIRAADHFPGQMFGHQDVHVLLIPSIDFVVTEVEDFEDAQKFCNRLGKRVEYHVYGGLGLGLR